MISNQILQNTIDGLKTIARVDFEVLDTEGKEVATTAEVPFGGRAEAAEFCEIPGGFTGDPGMSVF